MDLPSLLVLKPAEIVDGDAIAIGELYERSRLSVKDSMFAARECGLLLIAKKASLKHGEWLPWLTHNAGVLGFAARNTSAALMRMAKANVTPALHLGEDEYLKISRKMWGHAGNAAKKKTRDQEIEDQRQAIESGDANLPEGVFEVVVMDPPWDYGGNYDPVGHRGACPYPEMTQAEILAMAPPFADDSVLFLWTTHKFIWDAKSLIDEWGFEYKATLVWDKEKMGIGHWFRMQCEFCLLGIKGKPTWNNTEWRDIIREPRREHSRKPEVFYHMVEKITVGRRLDYFSRGERQGWEAFGNDTAKF